MLLGKKYDPKDMSEYEKCVKDFDAALKKYPLDENILIWRGVTPEHYEDWEIGKEYSVPIYQSCAVLKNSAWSGKGMTIKIRVPKGTPGAYIDGHGSNPKEEEYVLTRGLKYKVLDKTEKIMELEVVP